MEMTAVKKKMTAVNRNDRGHMNVTAVNFEKVTALENIFIVVKENGGDEKRWPCSEKMNTFK